MDAPIRVFRTIATLAFLLIAFALPAPAMEVIRQYHSEIRLEPSGAMLVTETITVNAEGYKIKRGIFRDFPVTFIGDDGVMHRVDFAILSIERDGEPEDYHTETIDNGVRIYIGHKDRLLPPGEHVFRIRYTTGRQIRYFPNHDELFWNVTGNGWDFPIDKASADVILPDGARPEATVFYTGPAGARDRNARVSEDGARIAFATTLPLDLHEGLTIGVKLPKGVISAPSGDDLLRWRLLDRRNAIAAGIGLLVVLTFYGVQWLRVGRDPRKGVVIPRWNPPADLSPALVNYIDNRGFSAGGWTAFSASAIHLAVKGLITLEDLSSGVTLKGTGKEPDTRLPLGEDKIFNEVRGGYLEVSKASGLRLQRIGDTFRKAIDKEHSGKYHRYNLGVIVLGILLTILTYVAILMVGDFTQIMLGFLIVPAFLFLFVAIFSAVLMGTALQSPMKPVRIFARLFLAVFWLAFLLVIAVSIWAATEAARSPDDMLAFAATTAMIVTAMVFTAIMGAATPLGRELKDGIEGMKLYLTVAEQDRMNFAGAPAMSPKHYETLLPYAVALGLEKPWSEHFQTWLDTAGASAAAQGFSWYGGRDFDHRRFGQRMSGFSSSLSTTIASSLPPPPRSSSSGFSSSGGSSSGGGGGGGGGGGW